VTIDDRNFEPVFIAANVREIGIVEALLEEEGIEYMVRPEAFQRGGLVSGVCFTGLQFEVLAGQADYCRKLFAAKGLETGVL
jgi:hypothetical protein